MVLLKKLMGGDSFTFNEMSTFFMQMYVMLDDEMNVSESIDHLMIEDDQNKLVSAIHEGLENDLPIHECMRNTMKIPYVIISVIENAAKTGHLPETFKILSEFMGRADREIKLMQRMFSYPSSAFLSCLLILHCLSVYAMPTFESVYRSFGTSMNLWSNVMSHYGNAVRHFSVPIMLVLCLVFLISDYIIHDTDLVTNMFLQKTRRSMWIQSIYMMHSSGVSWDDIMEMSEQHFPEIKVDKDEYGIRAIKPSLTDREFSVLVTGNDHGKLSDMLALVSSKSMDNDIKGLSNVTYMMDPIITMINVILIGASLVSITLPLIQLVQFMNGM